jgi:hypothetical protein
MPILLPGPPGDPQLGWFNIQQLEFDTLRKLENDQSAARLVDIDRWLRDAIIEITGNPDYRDSFPELEVLGPLYNLQGSADITQAVSEYSEKYIVPQGDVLIKTLDILLWTDPPWNRRWIQLTQTHYQDVDRFASMPSQPTQWYRFGYNIGFDPPPNQNFQVQARLQRRHPFLDYFNELNVLNQTPVLMPAEWLEVIEWAAAMRGYMEMLNMERANMIRTLLWGDPAHPNDNPGLIAAVKTKRRQEAWMAHQPLRPVIKGACWGEQ